MAFGFGLLRWLRYFRANRLEENLSQSKLLKQEIQLIAFAILTIVLLFAFLFGLAIIFGR